MTKQDKLLPLGTAVLINSDHSAYIITARVLQIESDESTIARYKAVPHPWGENSKYKSMIFSEHDIIKVLQKGYETEVDISFYKEKLDTATYSPSAQKEKDTENRPVSRQKATIQPKQTTQLEKKIPKNDPFFNLRKRGKSK